MLLPVVAAPEALVRAPDVRHPNTSPAAGSAAQRPAAQETTAGFFPDMKVSPINLKTLAYTLDVEGFDSGPLLQEFGLPAIDLIDEDGEWVPVERFDEMMAAALRLTADPSFGLVAGKSLALMRYGLLVPLILHAPSLRVVLRDVWHFSALAVEKCEVELQEPAEGSARLVVEPLVQGGLSGRFRMEFVATSAIQMVRFGSARSDEIREVHFPYPCPPGMEARYAATFGTRVRFEQKECAVHFDPAVLDRPMASHDPVAYMGARTRVEHALAAHRARNDIAERVRQKLLKAFPVQLSLDETARSLDLSARTLRRQLTQLGTSHQLLSQECQTLLAERLLAEGKLSLKQIANAIGFSSVSSFHRAFRRWTGVTPTDWRDGGR